MPGAANWPLELHSKNGASVSRAAVFFTRSITRFQFSFFICSYKRGDVFVTLFQKILVSKTPSIFDIRCVCFECQNLQK